MLERNTHIHDVICSREIVLARARSGMRIRSDFHVSKIQSFPCHEIYFMAFLTRAHAPPNGSVSLYVACRKKCVLWIIKTNLQSVWEALRRARRLHKLDCVLFARCRVVNCLLSDHLAELIICEIATFFLCFTSHILFYFNLRIKKDTINLVFWDSEV